MASSWGKSFFRSWNRNLEAREIIIFRTRDQKWYTQKILKKVDVENMLCPWKNYGAKSLFHGTFLFSQGKEHGATRCKLLLIKICYNAFFIYTHLPSYPIFFFTFHTIPQHIGLELVWDILLPSSSMDTTCNQDLYVVRTIFLNLNPAFLSMFQQKVSLHLFLWSFR